MFKLLLLLVAVTGVWGVSNGGILNSKISKRSVLQSRITGGANAAVSAHPYQLALNWYGQYICGAAMIGSKWALTAAHCASGAYSNGLSVVAGSTYLDAGQIIPVLKTYQNPKYNSQTLDYDISILELRFLITVPSAEAVALHASGYVAAIGTIGYTTGWGRLYEWGQQSYHLQVAKDQIVNRKECNELYDGRITSRMVCAGNLQDGGQSFCRGDSGGPLVVYEKLYGIASWGYTCGNLKYPGVYTKLSEESIRAFIRNISGI